MYFHVKINSKQLLFYYSWPKNASLVTYLMFFEIALTLIGPKKNFNFSVFLLAHQLRFGTLIPKIYIYVHSKYFSKWVKTSGKLQFLHNCKFPEVFGHFRPLRKIFAIDIYIFLESVRQGTAGKPMKL